jgi:hypothetical protein
MIPAAVRGTITMSEANFFRITEFLSISMCRAKWGEEIRVTPASAQDP